MSLHVDAIETLRGSLERDDLDDEARSRTEAGIQTLLDLEAEDAEREALERASAEATAEVAWFEAQSRKERDREAPLADIMDRYNN